jgi:carboxyl-terminal processing protease
MPFGSQPLPPSFKALLITSLGALIFVGGFAAGRVPTALGQAGDEGRVLGIGDIPSAFSGKDVDFKMFWDIWDLVKSDYVDQPVSDRDLFYGALEGMLYGLKDPYSTFFNPDSAAEFNQELEGTFFGIGAEIGLDKDGNIVVIAPLPETPAADAGVRAEDRILMIDGKDTAGMTVNEAVSLIRGEKGTPVKITFLRAGTAEPFEVSITRDEIKVDSVKVEVRDDGIAVIRVSIFNEDTNALFKDAVEKVTKAKAKGLILDLRNNPGGLLDSAINLAGYWMDGKTAVMEEIKGERTEFTAEGPDLLKDMPTVVLVNGGSASASEILSGALQDYHMATLIGETTFGKGSVQEYRELPDGSAVKITIAHWLTPLGRSINKEGIAPDTEVPFTSEDSHANTDPQLEAALNLLKKE